MADKPITEGVSKASDGNQEVIKKQLAELRREITRINRNLSAQAEEAIDAAHGWYDKASDQASRAAQQVRGQAKTFSATVQSNSGTITTAMVLGGILGLIVGIVIARSAQPGHR